ncbi:antibiotic biosynthesis monooxygenase [Parabacteroides sp. 52]|nr:antibiotic biosynthesis monooxygenase [Parabacteroides sp. 52]
MLLGIFCSVLLFSSFVVPAKTVVHSGELTIVAHVTVKSAYKDDLMKAFKTVVDATRKEAGNVSYVLLEDVNNPLKFTFVEVWKSQEAIDIHNNSDHFKAFVKAVEGKADLEVSVLKAKF